MRRAWVVCVAVLLGVLTVQAATGIWKNFTSMYDVRAIVNDGSGYWAATSGGLFHWTPVNDSYQLLTNADGLRSIDLTAIAADATGNIWSGASTGIIHVYDPTTGSIRTILDIAMAKDQTNKRVNAISIQGDTALICTDFGLTVFHMSKFEFGDTYSRFGTIPAGTRTAVSAALIHAGRLWACVSDGTTNNSVATADLANPNLLPPESWTLQVVGSPGTVPRTLTVFNGALYSGTSAGLYVEGGGSWTAVAAISTANSIVATAASPASLLLATAGRTVHALDQQQSATQIGESLPYPASAIAADPAQNPVIGSTGGGVLTFSTSWVSHSPNGPNGSSFQSIVVDPDGVIWAGSGDFTGYGLYRFDGSTWTNFTTANSALPANEVYRMSIGCDGAVWASTYGRGIVEIPRGSNQIDASRIYGRNVGMTGIPNDLNYVVPSNAVCDSRGNVWMTVVLAADKNLLIVRQPDATWRFFPVTVGGIKLTNLMDRPVDRCLAVDAFDNVWMTVRDPAYRGVLSLGNGGTIDSTSAFLLSTTDGLPSNEVKTIVVDRDNDVWVGTDRGIAIILDPSNPRRTGGIAAYRPLNGLVINTIAVDPLNQKWVGTTEGVFLLTSDGTHAIESYTVDNTAGKLMDNDVKSVAVDGKTGTVYFGTAYGLASLTTAAAAPRVSFEGLTIYPNPFHIPTATELTVSGLVENSSMKIMTVDGAVIRDVRTPGGLVGFWDGKDNNGNDVSSGVYLIVTYSEDGSAVANGKVAVIKQ
jgi:ligand-binding sensor domain-containing protein